MGYELVVDRVEGELEVVAELQYQLIDFRWARNLADFDAPEPRRFVAWYDGMADVSAVRLAEVRLTVP